MTRSQVSETLPEERQEKRVKSITDKIPNGFHVASSVEEGGKTILYCYNPIEKDCTKAWRKIEA